MIELERARAICALVAPNFNSETTCMLMAAAIAGQRGLGMRNIRIGALFWPDKFAGEGSLSMRGGWGCEGFDARTGRLYLADETIDEDGGFAGHTWLERDDKSVVDLMHDYEGPRCTLGPGYQIIHSYIRRPKLERAVKAFWRAPMQAAVKAGRKAAS